MEETEKTKDPDGGGVREREERNEGESTLLPMLVAGLVLIVVGAIVVMMFV